MGLSEITINLGNHHNMTFRSKSLDMSHPCISYVVVQIISIAVNNNHDKRRRKRRNDLFNVALSTFYLRLY